MSCRHLIDEANETSTRRIPLEQIDRAAAEIEDPGAEPSMFHQKD
jgi:hypothetical protein